MLNSLISELYFLYLGASVGATLIKIAIVLVLIFAIIGVIATIGFFVGRGKKKKKDPYKEWLKTGKF